MTPSDFEVTWSKVKAELLVFEKMLIPLLESCQRIKINRGHLFPKDMHCTKFGNFQAKGSKDIERTFLGLQTDRPTNMCKTTAPFFWRGHKKSKWPLKCKHYYSMEIGIFLNLNKLESQCLVFGWHFPSGSTNHQCIFLTIQLWALLRKGVGPSFEQNWFFYFYKKMLCHLRNFSVLCYISAWTTIIWMITCLPTSVFVG